jgi:hypothetical protein
MHLVATQPEITVAGTAFILGVFSLAGVGVGLAVAAREAGRSPRWRLALLLTVPVFLSPGMVLAPALVLGGWGLRRGLLARLLAVAGVLTAPVALVAASWDEVQRTLMPYPDTVYLAVLGLGGAALAGALAWGGSLALGPWTPRGVRP